MNISCPNVRKGGVCFGVEPADAASVTGAVRRVTRLPLIVKLTPTASSVSAVARSVADAGADAVSLINTIPGMVIDVDARRPVLGNVTGGLSGPAIRPIALRMVWETLQQISIPVIGVGGIMNARDALQFLIAGATAVQIGTGMLVNPRSAEEIVGGIAAYVRACGCSTIGEIIGSLRLPRQTVTARSST